MYSEPSSAPAAGSTRLAWYREARFGMSLHFGAYSVAARGEWVRSVERLSVEDYQPYVDAFNPHREWAREWVALARSAGARYGVLTAKHHDGFCLFDSQRTRYTTVHSPAGRDLVREWVEACREGGLRVGLYYSLVDWHHPDYPAWQDRQHPLRHDKAARERDARCDWSRYVAYLHGQVEELCRNYGTIDLLIFDFSYWDYAGEKWGASELMRRIRALQPDVVVNDRLGVEALKQVPPPDYAGDFDQAEQVIPREGLRNRAGQPIPWESWFTLNNSWCFDPNDHAWKDATAVIRALVNCVSKDGNLTLNVSPDARGHVPGPAAAILREVGEWLRANGASVHGAGPAPWPKPEWGRFTRKGNHLYAHVFEPVLGHLTLPGLRGRVQNGRVLATGAEAILCDYWNPGIQTFDAPDDIFFNFGRPVQATFRLPDARDTVVTFDLVDGAARTSLIEAFDRRFREALVRTPF